MSRKRDLADGIMPYVGMTPAIRDTAAQIERAAKRYQRIQEDWTSVEMSDDQVVKTTAREDRLEARIIALVGDLPLPTLDEDESVGVWGVKFEGDPRGPVVTLVVRESYASIDNLREVDVP